MTSSPGFITASNALRNVCLPPVDTTICSGAYVTPESFAIFAHIAFLSSIVPGTGVYLVMPLSSAYFAASMIYSGVLKSGSPAPNDTTSIPCAFIALDFAVIASVSEGEMFFALSEISILLSLLLAFSDFSPIPSYNTIPPEKTQAFTVCYSCLGSLIAKNMRFALILSF